MGQPLTTKKQRTPDRLPERAAKVRINGRKLTLQQANGLNTPLVHEPALGSIGDRLGFGGFTLLGQLAMKTEAEMQRFLEIDFMRLMEDDLQRQRRMGKTPEELATLRKDTVADIPRKVTLAMTDIRLALGIHGLRMGMRILHWDNMQMAA